MDLSPAAAARTVEDHRQAETAPPANTAANDGEEDALAASIEGLVRADRETRVQAGDRAAAGVMWSALRPWKGPNLLLQKVRYWYIGRGIDAAIADDGSVAFHDKDGVVAAPLPVVDRFGPGGRPHSENGPGGPPSPGGRIRGTKLSPVVGISDAVRLLRRRAANEDPHAVERAEFLERTRALREWLDARTRERNAQRAAPDLLRELTRIWSAAGSLSRAQQREQTFAMWDGCDEGELGVRARTAIVDFVRKLARARGACPFDAATLAGLNARRRSREAFAPCDAEPAAESRPAQ